MKGDFHIDEFEDWLKGQADKHSMYPSNQLWRNINQQLHEQPRWPALTFGAILTGSLLTAALIFLHPQKDLLSVAYRNNTVQTELAREMSEPVINRLTDQPDTRALKPVNTQTALYSFNYTLHPKETGTAINDAAQSALSTHTVTPDPLIAQNELTASTITTSDQYGAAGIIAKAVIRTNPVISSPVSINGEPDENIVDAKTTAENMTNKEGALADAAEELEQTNNYKKTIQLPKGNKNRWEYEIYGGPNISYRRLTEPHPYNYHQNYIQNTSTGSRINNIVKQKPAFGFNIGTAVAYAFSDRLRFKTGLQFNFRQYAIDAYQSKTERAVLLLTNGFYTPDSIYTYTPISNEKGNAITINNRYYQIGIPIGLEWTVAKTANLSFNIAGSVQPTYQINSNMYQLTSDHKNYVQAPELVRRWNINAGVEAMVNFTSGDLQLQAGPQFLYQTLPSQKGTYSIRERLFDYGLRVGIVRKFH